MNDIDTAGVDSLKVLDPEWPIREADIGIGRFGATCGRLRVGKSFLHECSIGRCGHVFGL